MGKDIKENDGKKSEPKKRLSVLEQYYRLGWLSKARHKWSAEDRLKAGQRLYGDFYRSHRLSGCIDYEKPRVDSSIKAGISEAAAEAHTRFSAAFKAIPVEFRGVVYSVCCDDKVLELPDDVVMIPMDAILIEQVVVNILENAVQHASGMTSLTLRVFTLGSSAIFEIADNGCGIDPKRMDTLFTGHYASKHEVADSKKKNAGIGLSVCATIIKAHGGSIKAENLKTGGAVFRFAVRVMPGYSVYDRVFLEACSRQRSNALCNNVGIPFQYTYDNFVKDRFENHLIQHRCSTGHARLQR